jgi:G:T/U-mismatch repair DNA glycosylase
MPQSPSQKQQRMLEKAKSEKLFENVYEDERMTRKTQTTLHAIGTKDATQQAKRRKSRVHMQNTNADLCRKMNATQTM